MLSGCYLMPWLLLHNSHNSKAKIRYGDHFTLYKILEILHRSWDMRGVRAYLRKFKGVLMQLFCYWCKSKLSLSNTHLFMFKNLKVDVLVVSYPKSKQVLNNAGLYVALSKLKVD